MDQVEGDIQLTSYLNAYIPLSEFGGYQQEHDGATGMPWEPDTPPPVHRDLELSLTADGPQLLTLELRSIMSEIRTPISEPHSTASELRQKPAEVLSATPEPSRWRPRFRTPNASSSLAPWDDAQTPRERVEPITPSSSRREPCTPTGAGGDPIAPKKPKPKKYVASPPWHVREMSVSPSEGRRLRFCQEVEEHRNRS